MKPKFYLFFITLSLCAQAFGQTPNNCLSCGVSNASQAISSATGIVIEGSLNGVAASGKLVIESVKASGEGVVIVVKSSERAVSATVELSGKVAHKAALVAGQTLEASIYTTGYALILSGQIIAFIPNEIARTLTYHAQVPYLTRR